MINKSFEIENQDEALFISCEGSENHHPWNETLMDELQEV